jgi:hypothetical protein
MAWVLSAVFASLTGALLLFVSWMNLFARFRPDGSQRFYYEMDYVTGALAGIKNFSLLEGALCLFAAVGCFCAWSSAPAGMLLTVIGAALGALYFIFLTQYAIYIAVQGQIIGYSVLAVVCAGVALTRAVLYGEFIQDPQLGPVLYGTLAVLAVLMVAGSARMRRRAPGLATTIARFHLLQQYTGAEPPGEVALSEDWTWAVGAAAPDGFPEPAGGGHYSFVQGRPLLPDEHPS